MKRSIEDTPVVFLGAGNLATNLAKRFTGKDSVSCRCTAERKNRLVR